MYRILKQIINSAIILLGFEEVKQYCILLVYILCEKSHYMYSNCLLIFKFTYILKVLYYMRNINKYKEIKA